MSDPIGPPPPPMPREPGYTSRQSQLLGVTICCMIIPTIVISLRLATRLLVKIRLWWDDYFAFAALLFCYGANISIMITINPGLGRHITEVSPDQGKLVIQSLFAHQLCWTVGFGLIYVSILFLYIRLFTNTWLCKLSYLLQMVATAWTVLSLLILIFQCTPVSRFWDPLVKGHCIKQSLFYTLFGVITMILITALFFLPAPIVWKLHLTKSRKCGLVLVFSLGAFVCIASVVRVIQVVNPPTQDMTWNLTTSIIWSCLELNIGLMSACIPSLLPLLKIITGKRDSSNKSQRHTAYESRVGGTQTGKASKFNRMADDNDNDIDDGIPLGETVPQSSSQTTFDDNVRLVDHKHKPNEIMITNQIVQSHELKDPSLSSSSGGGAGVGAKVAPPTYTWS